MNAPTAVVYTAAVVAWMFGIAVALKVGVMWGVLAIVCPPVSWVFIAQEILSRL